MPIETKTVLSCAQCGGHKATANGWWLLVFWPSRIEIQPMPHDYKLADPEKAKGEKCIRECACGQSCVVQLVSNTLAEMSAGLRKAKRKRGS